jgi:hypothetical protein
MYETPLCSTIEADWPEDNHKPETTSDSSPSLRLKPSDSESSNYDLTLKDNSEKYAYQGVRTTGDGKYVLIFDPVKKHFVLHRIDSTFDMNLVSAPWSQDVRSQYEQIEHPIKPQGSAPQRRASKGPKKAAVAKASAPRQKAEKPKKPKPPVREPTPEEEASDDGLTIEYPGGPSGQSYEYNATPIFQRNISEEVSDEDEDAEGEEYEEERNQDVDHLKLPSPANNNAGGASDEDMEAELEAELEQALQQDSDESEEE